jgi:uncharacterized SAM-binding protein YcdF (DUF218 family)
LTVLNFLKDFLRPSSPLVLVGVFGVVAVWLRVRPSSAAARRLLLSVVTAYAFITTPLGAATLVAGLSYGLTQVQSPDDAHHADVVVVLGGGAASFTAGGVITGVPNPGSVLRALEGARVYRVIGARLLIVSGGTARQGIDLVPESALLRETVVRAGVPSSSVLEESTSKRTREQAQGVKALLASRGIVRLVLVTSPTHMRRAVAAFRAAGLDPIPSPSRLTSEHIPTRFFLLPNYDSLHDSDLAIYDYAATAYYWMRGWLAEPAR